MILPDDFTGTEGFTGMKILPADAMMYAITEKRGFLKE
jgi:hypothetical protein